MLFILITAIMIIAGATLLLILMRNKSIRHGERIAQEMVDNEGNKAVEAELEPDQGDQDGRDARRAREESEQPPRTPPTPPPVPPVPPMP